MRNNIITTTALHGAAELGVLDIVFKLLEIYNQRAKNADTERNLLRDVINLPDENGNTPLHLAVLKVSMPIGTNDALDARKKQNAHKIAAVLIHYGADPTITNQSKQTPLQIASKNNLSKVLALPQVMQHLSLRSFRHMTHKISRFQQLQFFKTFCQSSIDKPSPREIESVLQANSLFQFAEPRKILKLNNAIIESDGLLEPAFTTYDNTVFGNFSYLYITTSEGDCLRIEHKANKKVLALNSEGITGVDDVTRLIITSDSSKPISVAMADNGFIEFEDLEISAIIDTVFEKLVGMLPEYQKPCYAHLEF
ncbi:MAG: hypothetical protein Tsb005_13390 [Gammaproteobacteria bacterium]